MSDFYDFWLVGDYRVRMSNDEKSATVFCGADELTTLHADDETSANVKAIRWIGLHRRGEVTADAKPTATIEPTAAIDSPPSEVKS